MRQMAGMDYKDDIFIIGQVLKGNVNAFSHVVERHKDHVFNLAMRICGNREEAEEVAQDSFMKAYRSLAGFRMKSKFATWLYRIVYNTAVSYVRTRKKGVLSIEEFPADAADFLGNLPDEEAEAEYRNSLVNFALQKISDEDRAVISLYYYEELDTEDISKVTGLSKQNVKVKLFRARQKMMEIIKYAEKKNLVYHGHN